MPVEPRPVREQPVWEWKSVGLSLTGQGTQGSGGVKSMTNDERNRAAAVAGASSPSGAADICHRWWWVDHWVWTDRRLTRLEHSEPTTQGFRLWDNVLSERNLQAAFWAVWRNDGAPGAGHRGFAAQELFSVEPGCGA